MITPVPIADLRDEHLPAYLACLEEWSSEIAEAGDLKARWYARMKDQGLRVKLALDQLGRPAGMIQMVPSEHAPIEGQDLYFVLCIWVHGHRPGVGDQQGKGMGKALLEAAEAEARALGAKGLAAWGLRFPVWMKASWFHKHGYQRVDSDGGRALMFKPFTDDAEAPRWLRLRHKPEAGQDTVRVTACHNGWCQAMNVTYNRAKAVADEMDDVTFETVDTCCDRETIEAWGTDQALFIDDKPVNLGPPKSRETLARKLTRRVRRLHRQRAREARRHP